jgi:putative oxidoreductase
MKIAALVARILLGIMFTVFGLNGFLHFIPQSPPPNLLAGQYMGALAGSHYFTVVFAIQLVAGILFLSGRYVPLALTIIAPVIVNILLYHGLMDPKGIVPGLVATILWLILAHSVRSAFAGILQPRVQSV